MHQVGAVCTPGGGRAAFPRGAGLAPAGFLAGYRSLTREACTLDLRQFTGWCRARSLPLFPVRRAGIETFAREPEAKGGARATVTRAAWTRTPAGRHRACSSSAVVPCGLS